MSYYMPAEEYAKLYELLDKFATDNILILHDINKVKNFVEFDRRMKLFNAVNLIQNTVLNELSNSEKNEKKCWQVLKYVVLYTQRNGGTPIRKELILWKNFTL